jgi:hypothetical protein
MEIDMTDDLVKRLRTSKLRVMSDAYYLLHDAADRIEQLEKLLELRDIFIVKHDLWHEFVACAALGEKKDD